MQTNWLSLRTGKCRGRRLDVSSLEGKFLYTLVSKVACMTGINIQKLLKIMILQAGFHLPELSLRYKHEIMIFCLDFL